MDDRGQDTTEHGAERRRNSRGFQVAEPVQCELTGQSDPVVLNEVGSGGFSITAPRPLPTGSVHVFRFTFADQTSAMVAAEARHTTCLLLRGSAAFTYRTGFAFRDLDDPQVNRSVTALVERLMAALTVR
jgi:hypothetical protein